jgi:hypothetical protein
LDPVENKRLFHVSGLKEIRMTRTEQSQKKVIVDIDNTLWNLAPVPWEHLKAINPEMSERSEWSYWDFWERYVTMKDLYQVIRNVHMQQDEYPLLKKTE